MSIQYICECEKRLLFKDEHAGKKAICPGCQRLLVVPGPKANIVLEGEPETAPWTDRRHSAVPGRVRDVRAEGPAVEKQPEHRQRPGPGRRQLQSPRRSRRSPRASPHSPRPLPLRRKPNRWCSRKN